MPPIEAEPAPQVNNTEEQKPKIGIIYPPPEVRNIVDKTASFVARNGPEFESRIRQNEINNPKFNFLNPTDPYHAYYQHKVRDFTEGKAAESSALKVTTPSAARLTQETPKAIQEVFVPKEPPPEPEFIADPPSIKAIDLDVVRLTAQFVARNGRQFLTQLMNREKGNPQFDFLKPQHSMFNYFTKLVEQYTKVLIPPKDLIDRLKKECNSTESILEQVKYRVNWHKYQEKQKQQELEASERERVAYAMIDWHDFVVVETVDFQPNETGNFPTPTTPEEVGARVLEEERKQKQVNNVSVDAREHDVDLDIGLEEPEDEDIDVKHDSDVSVDEDMEQSDEEIETEKEKKTTQIDLPPPPPPPPISELVPPPPKAISPPPPPPQPITSIRPNLPPSLDQVIIRRNYDPKSVPKVATQPSDEVFLISPFTGEKIPASQVPKHVRIGLLDQKWIEQRDKEAKERRDEEQVYASGALIESSLKHLAERRTDIFGIGVDEIGIGKKLGEEERLPSKPEELIWDGHSASMETVAKRARDTITAEAQQERASRMKQIEEEREKIAPAKPPLPPPPSTSSTIVPASNPAFIPPPAPASQRPVMMPTPTLARPIQPPPNTAFIMPMPRPVAPAFLAPMPVPQAPIPSLNNPVMPIMEDYDAGAPPSKKQRTEENLIPEEIFLQNNKSPVTFKISVPGPLQDKPEWKLNNQMIDVSMSLTESISSVKARIAEELGMPAGKQKLQMEGLFLKDTNSLAFYNVLPNAVIQLLPKERGGRRK